MFQNSNKNVIINTNKEERNIWLHCFVYRNLWHHAAVNTSQIVIDSLQRPSSFNCNLLKYLSVKNKMCKTFCLFVRESCLRFPASFSFRYCSILGSMSTMSEVQRNTMLISIRNNVPDSILEHWLSLMKGSVWLHCFSGVIDEGIQSSIWLLRIIIVYSVCSGLLYCDVNVLVCSLKW